MEGSVGTDQLNLTDASPENRASIEPASPDIAENVTEAATDEPADPAPERGPSRLGRGWFLSIAAVLLVVAAGIGAGGYFALRFHNESAAIDRADSAALAAAVDCVTAIHAPDLAAITAAQQKILDCSTAEFGTMATMMAPILVDAYQYANATVEVTEMRAAVEKHNDDGTVDVLVAFRMRVPSNPNTQDQEVGQRLRVEMAPVDGQYKIAKLEPVMT